MTLPPLTLFDHEAVSDAIRAAEDYYEGDILRDLQERHPLQSVIVDAGAHIGNHSVFWLENVKPMLLVAFEPMPETFRLLHTNLSRYDDALAIPCALSSTSGLTRMARDEVNRGRSHISRDGTVRVPVTRLDDWSLPGVTLLKVDVEGWQAHVLRGAKQTLDRHHPTLLVEDGEGVVPDVLAELGLACYEKVAAYPGANDLYEWGGCS